MAKLYLAPPDVSGLSARAAAKAERRIELLRASAKIMADKGFYSMRLEDLGEAVGISGPAVYRYFSNKEEILTELMEGISLSLLEQGREIVEVKEDPRERLEELLDFQISFALDRPDLIRLHNRELFRMGEEGRYRVRKTQGAYLDLFADALREFDPATTRQEGRILAQLVVGMINAVEHLLARNSTDILRDQLSVSARSMLGLR